MIIRSTRTCSMPAAFQCSKATMLISKDPWNVYLLGHGSIHDNMAKCRIMDIDQLLLQIARLYLAYTDLVPQPWTFLAPHAHTSRNGPLIQLCSQNSLLLPTPVYHRRLHPPPFLHPHLPSSVSSGSSRRVCAKMQDCLDQAGLRYPGQAR